MSQDYPKAFIRKSKSLFLVLVLFSAFVNVLYLTGSLFMLEIYDRVIPGRSIPTLIGLCAIALFLYLCQGVLDAIRARVLTRMGSSIDADLGPSVFALLAELPLRRPVASDGVQPLRDLENVRNFVAGAGPQAFFDLPWIPFYIAICWAFHPLIGIAALCGAGFLLGVAILSEVTSRGPAAAAAKAGASRYSLAETVRRNAEVVRAMGMTDRLMRLFEARSETLRMANQRAGDITIDLGGVSKVARMMLQSGVLAIGAWLVIQQEATAGIIIAASILSARALAPVELAIANWRALVSARQSWARLKRLFGELPPADLQLPLPRPRVDLNVQSLTGTPPASPRRVVQDVSFALKAGQGLGIIGPSGSGKSSLVRLIAGVWTGAAGKVRIDGAALEQWGPRQLGRHIGYLPQDVELFGGTVAENICRFDPDAEPDDIIAAAQAAGLHQLILSLPEGYSTIIGENGAALSAGQRQRVALARALYGEPFVVILDEPNSNLDHDGEEALTEAILGVRARGGIVIVVAHRPSALKAVDFVLAMSEGRVAAFGPKDEILNQVLRPVPMTPQPKTMPARRVGKAGGKDEVSS
ncbi:MAG: type I secretion system permease/ATPase [Alsobacter sp.]